ncbi:MAG TPA: endonuclease [Cyanobacteria bacterium UBA11369]|nr:endonuclease [Cyanobacteria bacterium UBA11371]HBE32607.1 endonuclease [Cyanobacteria bacterium UBA11368]HBE47592.1 endonuclease [Cyanobacteria bacterium UBA11369]
MVYLLHFNQRINPNRPTQHYLGYAKDLDQRIRNHRLGRGARLCEVAKERGITFKVAEVWSGVREACCFATYRSLERQLKRQKNSRRFCPICNSPQCKPT